MEYPLAELIDRLSILDLKRTRLPRDDATNAEAARFRAAVFGSIHDPQMIDAWYIALHEVNGRIWDLEADIRQGWEGKLGDAEVGRRALAIRDINRERVRIKAEIACAVGEYAEVKVDHASAA